MLRNVPAGARAGATHLAVEIVIPNARILAEVAVPLVVLQVVVPVAVEAAPEIVITPAVVIVVQPVQMDVRFRVQKGVTEHAMAPVAPLALNRAHLSAIVEQNDYE